jgi:hypothetical protein
MKDGIQPVKVRLTLVLSQDLYHLVVEDRAAAGFEMVGGSYQTGDPRDEYRLANPIEYGWRHWFFSEPTISGQTIRWNAEFLPAGVYELVYYLMPRQPGVFTALPANAYAYYQPEVAGSSASYLISIVE